MIIGIGVAAAMLGEGFPGGNDQGTRLAVLVAGPLTGMAAMLICRHLVRSLES
jgi:hypothetical protein